jgi:hypothetical protein
VTGAYQPLSQGGETVASEVLNSVNSHDVALKVVDSGPAWGTLISSRTARRT